MSYTNPRKTARLAPELHRELRRIAFERDSSIGLVLDEAVALYLKSKNAAEGDADPLVIMERGILTSHICSNDTVKPSPELS